jgi:hypothetical protein
MTLSATLREYIAAAFPGLWIQTSEPDEAAREIALLARDQKWSLASWDIDQGLKVGQESASDTTDPIAALGALLALAQPESSALLVLSNFHRFLQSPEVVQRLANLLLAGKTKRCFVLVLSPVVQIPVELERQFVVLEHALPDRDQLLKLAQGVCTEPGDLPGGPALEALLDAAAGLTRYEAEGAYSLSLVRHHKLVPQSIWDLKTASLKKSGLLTLHRGGESFADLGGLEALKAFCSRALAPRKGRKAAPRGVLLLGPAGSGKSCFAKALGNQTGRPTLILDVGALMGSLVGSTEANVRQALRIVDAMAPCVCMLDEVDRALAGATGASTDSGVAARLFGTFLTWLSDHTSDVFVVCTSNDITKLPPEFSRAERFDGVFFCDLPSTGEKARIWEIYLQRYELPSQELPRSPDWTGAEIKSCCRLSALLDVSLMEAAQQVVPVAVTAAESVAKLRDWASGRCLSASVPGLYLRTKEAGATVGGRRVARGQVN